VDRHAQLIVKTPYASWTYGVMVEGTIWMSDDGMRWFRGPGPHGVTFPWESKPYGTTLSVTGVPSAGAVGRVQERVQKYKWMFSCPISRQRGAGVWILVDMPK
jgi:hypothetical protein